MINQTTHASQSLVDGLDQTIDEIDVTYVESVEDESSL